nr:hypothetical protein CFP56_45526 [Quercus suber]
MGAKWRIGDGQSIRVFKDNWILDASGGRVISTTWARDADIKVAELIDSGSGCWKSREIDECLVPFDAQRIKAIPLCITPQLDLFYWALEKNGAYSVKSGYRALCEEARNEEASGSSSDSLPTKTHLVKRRVLMDPICHLCNRAEEDTHHALWGCEAIRRVWDRDFHWANQFEAAQGSFQDLVVLVMTKPRIREVFATTAWFIWSHRKKTRLQERTVPLSGIRESVSSFMQLAMFTESEEAGLGVVERDSNGLVVAAMAEKIKQPHSVECLEMLAARRAMIFVKEIGLQKSHFESDWEVVIKGLQKAGMEFSAINWAFG